MSRMLLQPILWTLVLLSSICLTGPSWAADLLVPQQYTSIQSAIDAASKGDTVLVDSGVYFENIRTGWDAVDLTIKSVHGALHTTIDGASESDATVFISNSAKVRLEGFLIIDGYDSGVSISDSVQVEIVDCLIALNYGVNGAGIYNHLSDLRISGSTIYLNTAYKNGGGIYNNSWSLQISGSRIVGNWAGNSAGGSEDGKGGGIYQEFDNAHARLVNCFVAGNKARLGGGMYADGSNFTINHSTIAGNLATSMGGGVALSGGPSTNMANSIVWGNDAQGDRGDGSAAGVWVNGGEDLMVVYSDLQSVHGPVFLPGLLGNISQDPLFVFPESGASAPSNAGDYRLKMGSPCIDAATGSNYFELPPADDYYGDARPGLSGYDMGADEFVFELLLPKDGSWLDWLQQTTLQWREAPGAAHYTYWIGQDQAYETGDTEDVTHILRHGGDEWYDWYVTAHDREGNSVTTSRWRINYVTTTTTTTTTSSTTTSSLRYTTTTAR